MAGIRRTDTDPGWINRRLADLERQIRELRSAKRLPASTFPPGVIPTAALANPNAPGYVYLTATGFGLAVTGANVISSSVDRAERILLVRCLSDRARVRTQLHRRG